jgi:hypothetical protein
MGGGHITVVKLQLVWEVLGCYVRDVILVSKANWSSVLGSPLCCS